MKSLSYAAALALLASVGTARAFVSTDETRVEACAFAFFTTSPELGQCLSRHGEVPSAGIGIQNAAVSGPFPDPRPGSPLVAQASSSTDARFGVLRVTDLAGGLNLPNSKLRDAMATSRASFSDVLTFRAPAGMSTADFLSIVADVEFGFSAAVSPWGNGSVELHAYVAPHDFFAGNFRPGTGRVLAVADADGEHRDLFPDRALHLSLDNPNKDRFASFAFTVDLLGTAARVEGSAVATAWMGGISFSRLGAAHGLVTGDAVGSVATVAGITVSSASGELVLDPQTGRFGYLAAAAVPEPASLSLLGAGLALLAWRRRAGAAA